MPEVTKHHYFRLIFSVTKFCYRS